MLRILAATILTLGAASAEAYQLASSEEGGDLPAQCPEEDGEPPVATEVSAGEETTRSASAGRRPRLGAVRIVGSAPVLDGRLDDPEWERAPVAGGFVQGSPREGEPATEGTEARVLFDDHAIYVGIRAFDSSPEKIVARVGRRDNLGNSDLVRVMIDSFRDRRTAFVFAVNPAGVKLDQYYYADTQSDSSWDAVWDVATSIDAEGWTAEFRIPLSQLRFGRAKSHTFGINFGRWIARTGESSFWAPLSSSQPGYVSRFGDLDGLDGLAPSLRLEVMPYASASAANAPRGGPDEPRFFPPDLGGEIGLDIKYGVTTDLTLDLTLNPDFGQVEADPAVVNLSAFETFATEQRPFFMEGAGIFMFPLAGGSEALFYSRRIGRRPQGPGRAGGSWEGVPTGTRIWSAAKLSGVTTNAWSVGLLTALTAEELADSLDGGTQARAPVEPLSSYSVLRVCRDFREGDSALGFIGTTTLRDRSVADDLLLHTDAHVAGIDFRHRFGDRIYEAKGFFVQSLVRGSADALELTQTAPARYMQRPDADHLELDPGLTSLSGWSGSMGLWKVGGGPWRFGGTTRARSPGFEPNDLGFMHQADLVQTSGFVGYHVNEESRRLRQWAVNLGHWRNWSFGGDSVGLGGSHDGYVVLPTMRTVWWGVGGNGAAYSPTMLRGGPLYLTEPVYYGWVGGSTDSRKAHQASLGADFNHRPEGASWSATLAPSVAFRPTDRLRVSLGMNLNRYVNDRQWVVSVGSTDEGLDYILGRLDQTTMSLVGRLDFALGPGLTLQLYAAPFVSDGVYTDFKTVADPRAREYEARHRRLDYRFDDESLQYVAELGDGTTAGWRDPAYTMRRLRTNAVLRWEYRRGSTLYLVWSHGRSAWEDWAGPEQTPLLGIGRSFIDPAENVVMLKVSYWFSP